MVFMLDYAPTAKKIDNHPLDCHVGDARDFLFPH